MNLHDFEEDIHHVILSRGYDYYLDGRISGVQSLGRGQYRAVVEGTESYHVFIDIDEHATIVSSVCNCPFDGEVCKHEVALYYELRDMWENDEELAAPADSDLRIILENLPKEQLVETLMNLALNDAVLYDQLLYRHNSNRQEPRKIRQLVRSIAKKHSDRSGFIAYREADAFTDELFELLESIPVSGDPVHALRTVAELFEESIGCLDAIDDSAGGMGFLLTHIILKIQEITESLYEPHVQRQLMDQLVRLSNAKNVQGWTDYRLDILRAGLPFMQQEPLAELMKQELQSMLDEAEGDYYKEAIHRLLLEVIYRQGSAEESQQFMEMNRKYPAFRRMLLKQKLEKELYAEVINLAEEGEKEDAGKPGLVSNWKQWRYEAYKQSGETGEQKKLGRDLIAKGHFEYYRDLKQLAGSDADKFYTSLKNQLAKENSPSYTSLITEENDIEAIVEYVTEHPDMVENYITYLQDTHMDLVIRLIENNIRKEASFASNRSHYRHVCAAIRRFKKIAGDEAGSALVQDFVSTYRRKPAFLDELGKILR